MGRLALAAGFLRLADGLTRLSQTTANGQRFDVVVLDPSKQTRDREEVDFALRKYGDMNRLAIQAVLRPQRR